MDTLILLLVAVVAVGVIGGAFGVALMDLRPQLDSAARFVGRNWVDLGLRGTAWLALTLFALVLVFLFGSMLVYALLFTGGRIGGAVGLLVLGAGLLFTPGFCGWLVFRAGRPAQEAAPEHPLGVSGIGRTGGALPVP